MDFITLQYNTVQYRIIMISGVAVQSTDKTDRTGVHQTTYMQSEHSWWDGDLFLLALTLILK